jgi:hypothetical protein
MSSIRRILAATVVTAALALTATYTLRSQPQRSVPQPLPSPNAPNPNFPPGMNGPDITPPDQKKMDRQAQADVRADVEKLYQLVTELRDQVQKSDTTSTLSLSVINKAKQIEKLAKQVKERAKG